MVLGVVHFYSCLRTWSFIIVIFYWSLGSRILLLTVFVQIIVLLTSISASKAICIKVYILYQWRRNWIKSNFSILILSVFIFRTKFSYDELLYWSNSLPKEYIQRRIPVISLNKIAKRLLTTLNGPTRHW